MVHAGAVSNYDVLAQKKLEQASEELRWGSCRKAFDALLDARSLATTASAHAMSIESKQLQRSSFDLLKRVENKLVTQEQVFRDRCVKG
jgi:hypothetical protein